MTKKEIKTLYINNYCFHENELGLAYFSLGTKRRNKLAILFMYVSPKHSFHFTNGVISKCACLINFWYHVSIIRHSYHSTPTIVSVRPSVSSRLLTIQHDSSWNAPLLKVICLLPICFKLEFLLEISLISNLIDIKDNWYT